MMRPLQDWCFNASPTRIERLEAQFSAHAYSPHRHDTYAIGVTMTGVQSFHYRRSLCHSMPGTAMILHPDELHDGHAGSDEGFLYRMLYLPPALVQDIQGGCILPFISGGLSSDPRLVRVIRALLASLTQPLPSLEEDGLLQSLVTLLSTLSDAPATFSPRPDKNAACLAREYIEQHVTEGITLDTLEAVTGRARWSLSRDFRALFGTSPYRYMMMRRAARVKQALSSGHSLADVAASMGFADQSHMTRVFSQTFGLPPARWQRLSHPM